MLLAYIDCFAGLSGETLLEALFSVGLSREQVSRAWAALPRDEHYTNGQATKPSLDRFRKAVAIATLPPVVKQAASTVLNRLREAELATRNEETHNGVERIAGRHEWCESELRAAVGVVLGLSLMGVDRVECSPLCVGGWVASGNGQHGGEPRPVFSTIAAAILCGSSVPVYGSDQGSELVTPIGAALVATLASSFGPLPPMIISGIGYGKEHGGSNGTTPSTRETRLLLGARAPLDTASEQAQVSYAKVSATKSDSAQQLSHITVPIAVVQSAPEEATGNGHTDNGSQTLNPYISGVEEWIALSIKGHQQSGRQRV